jgi:DNA-binding LacI/PurR family transcriptional regulator
MINLLNTQGIPMVMVDTKEMVDGFSHIRPNHFGGAAKAVRYLHSLGHRKIGVITGDMTFACETERLSAYYMAMMQLGLEWTPRWIIRQPHFNEQSGSDGMREIIKRKLDVTAVICHGDLVARGAIWAALESGLRIPDDISIMGCDNQAWSARTDPPLTTVDVSLTELGQIAMNHLIERINNPEMSPQWITIEAKIVARGSTGKFFPKD